MTEKYKKLSDRSMEYSFKDPNLAIEAAKKGYALAKRNRNNKYIAHFIQQLLSVYRQRTDLPMIKQLNPELRAICTKLNDPVGLAAYFVNESFICIREGRINDGISQVEQGFTILSASSNSEVTSTLYTALGYLQLLKGNIAESLKSLHLGLSLSPSISDTHSEAEVLQIISSNATKESNIGMCYLVAGNYEKGKHHLLIAREQFIRLGNTTNYTYTLRNLGALERDQGNFEAGIPYLIEALDYARRNSIVGTAIDILNHLALCYVGLEQYDRGWECLTEAASLVTKHHQYESEVCLARALFFVARTDYEAAYQELQKTVDDQSLELLTKEKIAEVLSDVCAHLGKWEEGFTALQTLQEIRGRIYDQKKLWVAAELEIEYENKSKTKEIELLGRYAEQQKVDLASQALQLLKHHEFLDELKQDLSSGKKPVEDVLKRISAELKRNDQWVEFELRFTQSHGQRMKVLKKYYPTLTTTELKVCVLLAGELSTKAISSVLSISPRTVEWHRTKIRKKMNIGPSADLVTFLHSIE